MYESAYNRIKKNVSKQATSGGAYKRLYFSGVEVNGPVTGGGV